MPAVGLAVEAVAGVDRVSVSTADEVRVGLGGTAFAWLLAYVSPVLDGLPVAVTLASRSASGDSARLGLVCLPSEGVGPPKELQKRHVGCMAVQHV